MELKLENIETTVDITVVCDNCGWEITNCEFHRGFLSVSFCPNCKDDILRGIDEIEGLVEIASTGEELDVEMITISLGEIKDILE